MTTLMTVNVRAFSGEGKQQHRVRVEGGEVKVWDDVAGHYTTCHKISKRAQAQILRWAGETAKGGAK